MYSFYIRDSRIANFFLPLVGWRSAGEDDGAPEAKANKIQKSMAQLRHNFDKTVRKLLKISGRACKPDFVRHASAKKGRTPRQSFL
jgi:hypothetical protein